VTAPERRRRAFEQWHALAGEPRFLVAAAGIVLLAFVVNPVEPVPRPNSTAAQKKFGRSSRRGMRLNLRDLATGSDRLAGYRYGGLPLLRWLCRSPLSH
jgi:hypothetical protein